MGEIRNAYKILVEKPGWKWPLGRRRHMLEDNIRMNLRVEKVWIGCIWFRIDTSGGPLSTR